MLDAVSLVISVAALLFSTFVFVHNRRNDKRNLLLRIHEQLLTADQQDGRRILFEMYEQKRSPEDLSSEEFGSVNHALSALNMLGYLFDKSYIPRSDVLALWGLVTARARRAADQTGFLALRDSQNREPIWPYLRSLAGIIEADERHRMKIVDITNPPSTSAD
jgi:hypothetical protein